MVEIVKDRKVQTQFQRMILKKPSQEMIVALVTLVFIVVFSVIIDGFATRSNFFSLLQRVAVLGILSVGMAVVVIGRGIDLSQVAVMALSSAWIFHLLGRGVPTVVAFLLALAFALMVGAINGYIIAFIEIPPLFTTLATGIFFIGVGRFFMLKSQILTHLPETHKFLQAIATTNVLGIPMPILIFAFIAFIMHLFLSRLSSGRFIYAHGDSSEAARMTGIGIRPLTILEYVICALIGYLAGIVRAMMVAQVDMRVYDTSLIFDVILVVVIGGVSLTGGRGTIWSVVAGTILIGTLLNGMTLLNLPSDFQNIFKGLALLGAIILDNRLHPRDEETARQGDI